MLRLREVLKAMEMGRSLGQRRHGHFDHDANCATGPHPEAPLVEGEAERSEVDEEGIRFEISVDPGTGEPIYRRRQ